MTAGVIFEIRVLQQPHSDEWFVCVITADGKQSTWKDAFDNEIEAQAFASGLRSGLAWFAEGAAWNP